MLINLLSLTKIAVPSAIYETLSPSLSIHLPRSIVKINSLRSFKNPLAFIYSICKLAIRAESNYTSCNCNSSPRGYILTQPSDEGENRKTFPTSQQAMKQTGNICCLCHSFQNYVMTCWLLQLNCCSRSSVVA